MKTKNDRLISPDMVFCEDVLKPLCSLFSSLFCLGSDGKKIFYAIVGCCLDNTSIEDYSGCHLRDGRPVVGPDTVLNLGDFSLESMIDKCNRLLSLSVRIALKSGLYKNHDLAIDYHDEPFDGEPQEYTIKVMNDGRIRRCFRFGMAALVSKESFLGVAIQPYKEGMTNAAMVEKLLLDYEYDLVLADKFFCGVDVFNKIEEKGKNFLVPYSMNDTTDEMYKESILDGKIVREYKMRNRNGGSKKIKLQFQYNEEIEYYPYACNLWEYIADYYMYRWNIEILFKMMKKVRAKTSSPKLPYRLLLETMAMILANLWKLLVKTIYVPMKQLKRHLTTLLHHTSVNGDVMPLTSSIMAKPATSK